MINKYLENTQDGRKLELIHAYKVNRKGDTYDSKICDNK
jgi:hypothetical protein